MSQLTPADNEKLAELQKLCDECKAAIESQNDAKLKKAMEEACDKCKGVRQLIPELMELEHRVEAMQKRGK